MKESEVVTKFPNRVSPESLGREIRLRSEKDPEWYRDITEALREDYVPKIIAKISEKLSGTMKAQELLAQSPFYHIMVGSTFDAGRNIDLSEEERKILEAAEAEMCGILITALNIE